MKGFWLIIFSFIVLFCYSQTSGKEFLLGPEDNDFADYTFMFSADLFVDGISRDFKEFEPIIGSHTINNIYPNTASFVWGFSCSYQNLLAYIHYGSGDTYAPDNDSVYIDLRNHHLDLGIGMEYFFKNIHIAPQLGFRWQYSKLKNTPKRETTNDLNLLMKFTQFYAYEGIRLGYRFYTKDIWLTQFIIFGAYFNYMIPINKYPYVKQDGIKQDYDYKIKTEPLNWGIYFSFAFGD